MRRFLAVVLATCTLGCQTFGSHKKTTSGWYALEKAAEVKCSTWPLREKDLQLDETMAVRAPKSGFLATGLKRDASPLTYYAPFKGETKLEPEDFTQLDLGRDAVMVGAVAVGGAPAVLVVRNGPAKATLEIRGIKDNVVKAKAEIGSFNVVDGTTLLTQDGAFVSYKAEDNVYHLAFVDTKKLGVKVAGVTYRDRPAVLTQADHPGAVVVWREGDGGKPFKAQAVGEDGAVGKAATLAVEVASQVESWTATAQPGGDYLAFVDGDSLIGTAELKLATFDWNGGAPVVKGTKAVPLRDVHATEPVFAASAKGLEILLLNWIDEESTIARYMVAGGAISKPVYAGVYPKGTRIVDAFTGDSPDDLWVVTRHRDDTRWAFQVCEL